MRTFGFILTGFVIGSVIVFMLPAIWEYIDWLEKVSAAFWRKF